MPDKRQETEGETPAPDRKTLSQLKPSPTANKVEESFEENPPPEANLSDEDNPVAQFAEAYDRSVQFEDEEPPKGAYIENALEEVETQAVTIAPRRISQPFSDEFTGKGGRYVIHPETGERQPVYERYLDPEGKAKTRRAV